MRPAPRSDSERAVLVTGASGLIGREIVRRLARRRGTTLFALSRHPVPCPTGQVVPLVHDLLRPLDSCRLPRRIDLVIHCASPWGNETDPRALFGLNVDATLALLAFASRASARRFVFLSSGGVTGYRQKPISEETPLAPLSPYLAAKAAGELLVRAHRPRVPFAIVRPFFVYGPEQRRGLLPLLHRRMARGEPVVTGHRGEPALNPIHVHDAARLILRIATTGPDDAVVNLAGSEVVTMQELASRLGSCLSLRPLFVRERRHGLGLVGDTTRLARYGEARIPLRRGLASCARAWRSLGED